MLTKEEKARVKGELVAFLLESERYTEQDIINKHALEGIDREVIWEAREEVRQLHGIDFGPIAKWPGSFERKSWDQIANRARRQRAKGTRAHRRAEERMRLAAAMAPKEQQPRLSEAADRMALRAAMRAAKG